MITRKLLLSISIITVLVASSILAAIPAVPSVEAQQKVPGADWKRHNGDQVSSNFSPQTQITKDNVNFLQLDWMFAFPSPPATIGGYNTNSPGSTTGGLIRDGIYYMLTNYGNVIALSMDDGKVVWNWTPDYNLTQDLKRGLPIQTGTGGVTGNHGMEMFEKELIVPSPACSVTFVDALLGKTTRKLRDMCAFPIEGYIHPNIPDQQGRTRNVKGSWGYKSSQSYPPSIYEKERVLIAPAGATSDSSAGGRGFFAGYDYDTLKLLWRFYLNPPDGGDKDWVKRYADKGWIQGYPAKEIVERCPKCVESDWGDAIYSSAGPGWGMYAVDEETGIVYVGTAQPGPDWNATYRPGPNVFGDSIIALKAKTGELVWWFQTWAHDLYDYDCAWSVALAKKDGKKVIVKGCKGGVTWGLDAATGEPLWHHDPGSPGKNQNFQSKIGNTAKGRYIARCTTCFALDPFSESDMRKPWGHYPSKDLLVQNCASSGCIESDHAVAYGNVYVAIYNFAVCANITPVPPDVLVASGGRSEVSCPKGSGANTTIVALDILTGAEKWAYFIPDVGYRGGLVASGGMIWSGHRDGVLRVLDAETGKLVWERFFGVGISVPPVIAADAKGKIKIVQQIGGRTTIRTPTEVPGAVMAFSLPAKLPEPQVVTKEVIKEVPKEVVKEVIKEVPKTVTVETVSPVSYAAIGVGVVLVVIAGILFTRRKKA